MRKIKEICKEIAKELQIMVPENVKLPGRQLKMSDIMSEEEWLTSGVTCLAARPGIGKIRNITGIDIPGELSVSDKQWIESTIAYIEKLNMFIDATHGITVTEIEAKLQELQELQDVGMVMIDYIQLVTGAANRLINGHDNIRWIVQSISRIAAERQISVVLLSTLPRSVEFRLNKRPCLEVMYYGIYARDVDQVIFLYREKIYRDDTQDDSSEIIIAKSKSGINQTVQVWFNEKHRRFEK